MPISPNSELARELRALLADLARQRLSDDAAEGLIPLVRDLRARVVGTPRRKWWTADGPSDEGVHASRRTFAETSLFRGDHNPLAPPLRYVVSDSGDPSRVVGLVTCGAVYEGPPGGVHGGYVAGLFDDVLGHTVRVVGGGAVTGRLQVRYRRITPIDTDLRFVAWVDHERGRRIVSRAQCWAGTTITAEAEALFVRIDFADVAAQSRATAEDAR